MQRFFPTTLFTVKFLSSINQKFRIDVVCKGFSFLPSFFFFLLEFTDLHSVEILLEVSLPLGVSKFKAEASWKVGGPPSLRLQSGNESVISTLASNFPWAKLPGRLKVRYTRFISDRAEISLRLLLWLSLSFMVIKRLLVDTYYFTF